MQFTYAAISALLASVAYSQSVASAIAQLPSCSLACLATAAVDGGCGADDFACQCGSARNSITKAATPCVVAACSTTDALNVSKVTTQICVFEAAAGSSSASSSASSTEASSSSAASSSSSSAVSNMTSAGSSIASATKSASSVVSSVKSSASSVVASATSAAAVATASTAAGNRVAAAGAVVGAGFLAAFAL